MNILSSLVGLALGAVQDPASVALGAGGVFSTLPPSADPIVQALTASAIAHHGPGTSGGGSSTISGETLKKGTGEVSLRLDYTAFRSISREDAEDRASRAGEFDAVDRAWLTTLSVAVGITDDVQVGASIGAYRADNFVSAEQGDEGVESGVADPTGLTDVWLQTKVNLVRSPMGHLAVVGGLKLPTGRDDVRLDTGERLEPSSQPGSGAIDVLVGVGFSRFITANWTIDASVAYTLRTARDDFRVGDRFEAGAAVAYRFGDDVGAFPQWSVFGELGAVLSGKDRAGDEHNENSGGSTVFLTPGVRLRITPQVALTLAPSIPIWQDLNGDQDDTRFKVAATLSWSF